jgi:hypothetical protein
MHDLDLNFGRWHIFRGLVTNGDIAAPERQLPCLTAAVLLVPLSVGGLVVDENRP